MVIGVHENSSNTYVGPWNFKPLAEVLTEMGTPLDGYDWDLTPVEYSGGTIGVLNIYAARGTTREVRFEYGIDTDATVADFGHIGDASGLLTKGWVLPPGYPAEAGEAQSYQDDAARSARGLHEGLVQTDLTVEALRVKLLQTNVIVRRVPRQRIELTAHGYAHELVPRLGSDYDVGDVVWFLARENDPTDWRGYRETVNASFRVFSVDVAIDDAGVGVPQPVLVVA